MVVRSTLAYCIALLLLACQGNSSPEPDIVRLADAHASLLILRAQYLAPASTLSLETYTHAVDSILHRLAFTQEEYQRSLERIALDPARFRSYSQFVSQRLSVSK
ncbi:MAG TPA: hypothetical protein VII11_05615 [Bacteroidota bacterium]